MLSIDLLELKIFVAVAELKSMSKAAERIHLTQPSVSTKIANLENELQVKLFVRLSKGVELSLEGRRFYYYALYATTAIDVGKQAVQHLSETERDERQIRVGITNSLLPLMLPLFQQHMNGKTKRNGWRVMTGGTLEIMLQVQTGLLDVGFVNDIQYQSDEVKQILMFEDPVQLIGAVGERASWRSFSTYAESSVFILLKRGMPLRELVEKGVFERLRVYPKQTIEVDTIEAVKLLVVEGLGYSFVPSSSLWKEDKDRIRWLDCEDVRVKQGFYCIYRPSMEAELEGMVEGVVKGVREKVKSFIEKDIV